MGIVCELHLASDSLIAQIAAHPDEAAEFVGDNFNYIYGKFHNDDTFGYLDKGWDVAFFLLKEADPSPDKILSGWRGKPFDEKDGASPCYLTMAQVKAMASVLAELNEELIKGAFNFEKMEAEEIYRAGPAIPKYWDYFIKIVNSIVDTFKRAAEANEGIIINFS